MSQIFISYARKDGEFARRLATSLSNSGIHIWIDVKDIPAGMNWSNAVQNGLKSCDALILIITPDSMKSDEVQAEWQYFRTKKKPIIPILLKETPDLHYQMLHIQYIDFLNKEYEVALSDLYEELKRNGLLSDEVKPVSLQEPTIRTLQPSLEITGQENTIGDYAVLPEPFEWCAVPVGHVEIAYANDSAKKGFSIPKDFWMSKYPITNAQYQKFIDASNGYSKEKWWDVSAHARQWREKHPQPAISPFKGDTLPRVMVTWYEAMAYCDWLSNELGHEVRLPKEQEWQRAVQGDDARKFPWGDRFDFNLCNIRAESVTSVVRYPMGASPYGVMDMAGNICEWTLNKWGNGIPNVVYLPQDLEGDDKRVLRGYPHYGDEYSKVVGRCDYAPDEENNGNGFRVVTHCKS